MEPTSEIDAERIKRERRLRVVGERVACRRIGPTDVRRCAECVYLLRLAKRYVVCVEGEITEERDDGW